MVERMDMWARYVETIVDSGEHWRQTQERSGVSQATMSRWRSGEKVPDKAAVAAYFARSYGRNPLEAFVAAGMLTLEEAGTAISSESVLLLRSLARRAGPGSSPEPVQSEPDPGPAPTILRVDDHPLVITPELDQGSRGR